MPDQPAIIEIRTRTQITFKQLEEESNLIASGLLHYGLKKGDRVIVMVPYGVDFVTLTFGLFKTGAVPVLIDPGLGKKKCFALYQAIRTSGNHRHSSSPCRENPDPGSVQVD